MICPKNTKPCAHRIKGIYCKFPKLPEDCTNSLHSKDKESST
jgi:hypothetical protein